MSGQSWASQTRWLSADIPGAERLYNEALQMLETVNVSAAKAEAFRGLAWQAQRRGEGERAESLMLRELEIARANELRHFEARALTGLGELARDRQDFKLAETRYLAALEVTEPSNFAREVVLFNLACCALDRDDIEAATNYLKIAWTDFLAMESRSGPLLTVDAIGCLLVKRGDYRRGGRVMGFTTGRLEQQRRKMEPLDQAFFDRIREEGRAKGGEQFEQTFVSGLTTSLEDISQIIQEAL